MNKVEMMTARTLLKPLKVKYVKKEVLVEDTSIDYKPGQIHETKKEIQKAPANFQLGEVIAISNTQKEYSVGDVVVFRPGRESVFDLIKKAVLISDYDVVCKWSEVEQENELENV
jgi:hypothetical protein